MKNYYIEQLTWLRGIAAFLVIISHSIRASEIKYSPIDERSYFLPLGILDLGSFGVALFFVLSGCTLWISNKNLRTHTEISGFYIKRILRIWPAYAISLFLYMGFINIFKNNYIGPYHPAIHGFLNDHYSFNDVIRYLTLSFNITGPKGLFTGAYWSLPVEFQFYILFPILAFSAKQTKSFGPILFGALFYLAWKARAIDINRYEVLNLSYTFCAGITIGYLYTENIFRWRFTAKTGILLATTCFAGASIIYNNKLLSIPIDSIPVRKWDFYGVFAIFSVFFLLFTEFKYKNLFTNFLSLYGKISYSIYLLHGLAIGTAILLVVKFGIFGDSPKLFFIFSFTISVSFIFAYYFHSYIEVPGIMLGRKLSSVFSQKQISLHKPI